MSFTITLNFDAASLSHYSCVAFEQLDDSHYCRRAMSLRNAALGLGGFSIDEANASKSRWVSMSVRSPTPRAAPPRMRSAT